MTDNHGDRLDALEEALGYRFRDREILERALRHGSSVMSDLAGTYQRLEFLGDAILGHATALMLFERFPTDDQGALTRKRVHLVRSERLAERAALLGLDGWVEVGFSVEKSGGRGSTGLLEDVFEAVVGAIAIDGGWDEAWAFVERQLGAEADELDERTLALADPKSALQEAAQARNLPLPVYRLLRAGGTDHHRLWTYALDWDGEEIARGEGRSKRSAQQRAARRALVRLGLVPEE
ncbi:MAG TPA: ribonuclease III [Methylomirabilota bacterium]|nr:ribonuclease III [Methylomirabilota bacterium]